MGTRTAIPEYGGVDWSAPAVLQYLRIPSATLRPLCAINNLQSAMAIAFDLSVIAATILAAKFWLPLWCYPLAAVVIGARQQGLIILLHEAAHRKLFRGARLNDFVGEVVLAWPFFISMMSYRSNHVAHHRHLNSELDPDWVRYLTPAAEERENWRYQRTAFQVIRPLLLDLVGFGAIAQVKRAVRLARPRNHDPRRATDPLIEEEIARKFPTRPASVVWTVRIAVLTLLAATGAWLDFLFYWLIPALTMLKMCTRIRLMSGHFAISGGEGMRTTLTSMTGRFLLGPHQIGYHAEHHLYPAVFFRRLPELHRMLVCRGDYDGRLPLRLTQGYRDMITDWTRAATPENVKSVIALHEL